jgi:hypothetical protein
MAAASAPGPPVVRALRENPRGYEVKWSVGIETQGDRVLSREEVVELADAVAASSGIATGIGTNRYGAQLLVDAATRDEAIEKARAEFARAVAQAGLPEYPIVRVEAVGEDEDGDGGSGGVYSGGEGEDSSVVQGQDFSVQGEDFSVQVQDFSVQVQDSSVQGGDPGVPGEDSPVEGKDSGG